MFQNFWLKALALVLAIILWILVVIQQPTLRLYPTGEGIIPQVFNLAPSLALIEPLPPIYLRLDGSPTLLDQLSPKDFNVFIDLKDRGAGTLETKVFATTDRPDVFIKQIEPSSLTLTLAPLTQKTLPVIVRVQGAPAEYFVAGTPVLTFDTVTVQGSIEALEKAHSVVALLPLTGLETTNQTQTLPLVVVDTGGTAIATLTPEKPFVEVTVPINRALFPQTLPTELVTTNIDGNPNYQIGEITYEPHTLDVLGTEKALQGLDKIPTLPLDLSTISTDTHTLSWNLPDGVTLAKTAPPVAIVHVQLWQRE